eukprot:TRINITY_DN440_c0_g1_i1.p1 TRINITY_DN440_c0_g1~~TRINITY_DN440_c0_g1_i1.p1  ORF type:complete len:174 (-),score=47.21 TRINITY_DN440_c0_g1_i1:62-583(-)
MNMYQTPFREYGANCEPLFDEEVAQEHYDGFYEDFFQEMAKYGEIEEVFICRNLGDHLVGNVYLKYYDEEAADDAIQGLQGRYYGGRIIVSELSPVTDFREARCRQFDNNECQRGGYCNFMHLQEPSREVRNKCMEWQKKYYKYQKNKDREARRARTERNERKKNKEKRESRE